MDGKICNLNIVLYFKYSQVYKIRSINFSRCILHIHDFLIEMLKL